jgi:hypothetical protein
MKLKYSAIILVLILSVFATNVIKAQYASTKLRSKHQIYTDSLKNVEYNHNFPILGQGAYKKGFDIPYPVGIMGNFMWMKQGVVLENMQLGLTTDNQDIPLTPIDFIEFGDNVNTSYTVNLRPDLWIFPFLNVYGIFGYGRSTTEVKITAPIQLTSIAEQNISTAGFGVMSAFGVGPVWVSVDANWTWNKPELLDKAVNVNVLGIRFGHTFTFKNKPDRNIAIWAGGMRAKMSSQTSGAIAMIDALPAETWDRRDEITDSYWEWYNGLDPNKPLDARKIEKADEVLTPIVDRIDAADGDAVVKYGMDKQVKEMWNGVFGLQFQYSKRWMFRTEAGLIGDRKSFLASVNYRFLW